MQKESNCDHAIFPRGYSKKLYKAEPRISSGHNRNRYQPLARPSFHHRESSIDESSNPPRKGIRAYRDPLFDLVARRLLERRSNTPIIPDRSPRNFLTCFLNFGHAPAYVIPHTSVPWPIFLPPPPPC